MIDDNPADVVLMRHAVQTCGMRTELRSVPDGPSAFQYLQRNPAPDLLILDFCLAGDNGAAILSRIQANTSLRAVFLSGLPPHVVSQACTSRVEVHQKPDSLHGWLDLADRILSPSAGLESTSFAA